MEILSPLKIKLIRALKTREERYLKRYYWAEGERTLLALIEGGARIEFFVTDRGQVSSAFHIKSIPIYQCRERDLNKIKATESFPGIAAVVKMPPVPVLTSKRIIALDRINDPGNLGTIFRTALWFGVEEFLIDQENADPYNEKTVRSSMGSIAGIRFNLSRDLPATLLEYKIKGYRLIATDLKGRLEIKCPEKFILIFGNEAKGVSEKILELCDERIKIPGSGKVESLNVAVSAGIILHEIF